MLPNGWEGGRRGDRQQPKRHLTSQQGEPYPPAPHGAQKCWKCRPNHPRPPPPRPLPTGSLWQARATTVRSVNLKARGRVGGVGNGEERGEKKNRRPRRGGAEQEGK